MFKRLGSPLGSASTWLPRVSTEAVLGEGADTLLRGAASEIHLCGVLTLSHMDFRKMQMISVNI